MPDPISWSFVWPYYLAALLFGYLLGSLPFGLIVTRLAGEGDVRSIGSGNIGATNVLRTGRKSLAAITLLGDALKGTAAVLLAGMYGMETAIIAGLGAFLGHLFPIWLRFRGGKGVATFIGILLGLYWPAGLTFIGLWIAIAALTRYSSVAGLGSSLATPLLLMGVGEWRLVEVTAVLTGLLWAKHYQNIGRLISGRETRIDQKK